MPVAGAVILRDSPLSQYIHSSLCGSRRMHACMHMYGMHAYIRHACIYTACMHTYGMHAHACMHIYGMIACMHILGMHACMQMYGMIAWTHILGMHACMHACTHTCVTLVTPCQLSTRPTGIVANPTYNTPRVRLKRSLQTGSNTPRVWLSVHAEGSSRTHQTVPLADAAVELVFGAFA